MPEHFEMNDDNINNIKLSICIPTLNRAGFLAETLKHFISQANDNVEIVIVDGASTDNTRDVVQKFQQDFKNLIYYRGEKKMGVDRDMAKAIELAHGEYCWLFSDDDLPKPGAINKILDEIKSKCEIYICNIVVCDLKMRPIRERFWLSVNIKDRVFNFQNKDELIEYCNMANSIGALFSYWCSIVLRREEWNKTGFSNDFDGTAYASAFMLFSFIKRKCRLKYIRRSLVLWRSNNESFQNAGGLVKRYLLDFDGYLKLADRYLLDNRKEREAFLGVMTREHPWNTIVNVTSCIDCPEVWQEFRNKLLKFGYAPKMIDICYALGRYKNLVSLGVAIKRKIVENSWVHRVAGLLRLDF